MSLVPTVVTSVNWANWGIIGLLRAPTAPFVQITDFVTLQNLPWNEVGDDGIKRMKTLRGEIIAEYGQPGEWYDIYGNIKKEKEKETTKIPWRSFINTPATLLIILIGIIFTIVLPIYLGFIGLAVTYIIYNYIRYPIFRQENGVSKIAINVALAPLYVGDLIFRKIFWRYY